MKSKNRVFISYAGEDRDVANKLFCDLKELGIIPWMNTEEILAGQNWKQEIRHAINQSAFFLALLSSHSVSKRGYVQKELKIALKMLDEFPQSDIFIIPVRLDDCMLIDERLQNLQWVDLFSSYKDGLKERPE